MSQNYTVRTDDTFTFKKEVPSNSETELEDSFFDFLWKSADNGFAQAPVLIRALPCFLFSNLNGLYKKFSPSGGITANISLILVELNSEGVISSEVFQGMSVVSETKLSFVSGLAEAYGFISSFVAS